MVLIRKAHRLSDFVDRAVRFQKLRLASFNSGLVDMVGQGANTCPIQLSSRIPALFKHKHTSTIQNIRNLDLFHIEQAGNKRTQSFTVTVYYERNLFHYAERSSKRSSRLYIAISLQFRNRPVRCLYICFSVTMPQSHNGRDNSFARWRLYEALAKAYLFDPHIDAGNRHQPIRLSIPHRWSDDNPFWCGYAAKR